VPESISILPENISQGRFFSKSYIKPSNIIKIQKNILFKKIGTVNEELFNKTKQQIIKLF
jgi:mRNA-degrading endonuclease toxin of MazEF toxin-antitoxin module